MTPVIKAGQIWKEVDPRHERFIRILGDYGNDPTYVVIETVCQYSVTKDWYKKPATRTGRAERARFNGKRGGYVLHQDVKPRRP
jgi:hypothetical protein